MTLFELGLFDEFFRAISVLLRPLLPKFLYISIILFTIIFICFSVIVYLLYIVYRKSYILLYIYYNVVYFYNNFAIL